MNCNSVKVNKDLKYCSENELKEFFNLFKDYFNSLICNSCYDKVIINMAFEKQKEAMDFWKSKGYKKGFANLTLIFEL